MDHKEGKEQTKVYQHFGIFIEEPYFSTSFGCLLDQLSQTGDVQLATEARPSIRNIAWCCVIAPYLEKRRLGRWLHVGLSFC